MYILGISAFYHDSAACLLKGSEIIAAAQEERFTRKKHDANFPKNAILYCLKKALIHESEIENIVFYEKPFLKFERLLETYFAFAPKGFKSFLMAMPLWIKEKLFQKSLLISELNKTLGSNIDWKKKLLFSEHHLSHAASAFYPSPFENAAILTIDGVGEWTTTSIGIGKKNDIKILKEIFFPHSIGLLYSSFTYFLGFKVNSGEYKVMGLAPYGKPKYVKIITDNLINLSEDGSFQLNMKFFEYATGLKMTNNKFNKLFGSLPRDPETLITQFHMDLAASIQKVTEDIVLKIAINIKKETGENNLCLAGGVALNCVINGILERKKIFKKIWIQPASGDAGGSLGAALCVRHMHQNKKRKINFNSDNMKGAFLGPHFNDEEIAHELNSCGAIFEKLTEKLLIEEVSNALVSQKAIGWMQGRMEFGPRALGARSIIADPRSPKMQKILNLKVKYRESFRPFAPSILSNYVYDWFDYDNISPYMLIVAKLKKEKCYTLTNKEKKLFGINRLNITHSTVPAITHVDYSARIQTVHEETNPKYHALISKFNQKTGCPLIVNTSFNIRGEPIVCSPTDAFKCFMGTELDVLAVGNYLVLKERQNKTLIRKYLNNYELD